MSEEIYTLNAYPVNATPQTTVDFNQIAVTTDTFKKRYDFYGADIMTAYGTNYVFKVLVGSVYRIPFSIVTYDTSGFYNPLFPGQLCMPPGFSYVEVKIMCQFTKLDGAQAYLSLFKNGGTVTSIDDISQSRGVNCEAVEWSFKSPIMPTVPGDYFEAGFSWTGSLNPTATLDLNLTNDYSGTGTITQNRHVGFVLQLRAYK